MKLKNEDHTCFFLNALSNTPENSKCNCYPFSSFGLLCPRQSRLDWTRTWLSSNKTVTRLVLHTDLWYQMQIIITLKWHIMALSIIKDLSTTNFAWTQGWCRYFCAKAISFRYLQLTTFSTSSRKYLFMKPSGCGLKWQLHI